MSDYETLRKLKVCYEYINDLLDNCDYINYEDDITRSQLKQTMSVLKDLYSNCYEMMSSNKESYEELKTDFDCPHCNEKILISDLIDYAYVCNDCDENLYLGEGDLNSAWYFDDKTKKLDKSFVISVNYDNDSKDVIIASKNSSKIRYNCDDVKSLSNCINSYIENFILRFKYIIQIWETEEDKDIGEPFEYLGIYDNDLKAISRAKKIFDKNNYACVEVIKMPNEESIFLKDSEEEQYYYDGKTISFVSNYILTKYIENWNNKKELPIDNKLLYCEDSDKYIAIDNTTNDCWVEEFKTKKETINWFLEKENEKENEIGVEI